MSGNGKFIAGSYDEAVKHVLLLAIKQLEKEVKDFKIKYENKMIIN